MVKWLCDLKNHGLVTHLLRTLGYSNILVFSQVEWKACWSLVGIWSPSSPLIAPSLSQELGTASQILFLLFQWRFWLEMSSLGLLGLQRSSLDFLLSSCFEWRPVWKGHFEEEMQLGWWFHCFLVQHHVQPVHRLAASSWAGKFLPGGRGYIVMCQYHSRVSSSYTEQKAKGLD